MGETIWETIKCKPDACVLRFSFLCHAATAYFIYLCIVKCMQTFWPDDSTLTAPFSNTYNLYLLYLKNNSFRIILMGQEVAKTPKR